MTTKHCLIVSLLLWFSAVESLAVNRHWTTANGLPTDEVQQIVELPNGQMLVNCEGVFCLSNGAGFNTIACDHNSTYALTTYAKGYGRWWQGDSLLWLHDFYHLYLFDARRRAFRYDIRPEQADTIIERFTRGQLLREVPDERQWGIINALGLASVYGTMVEDRQGALWIGTRGDGIVYVPPRKETSQLLPNNHGLIGIARSTVDGKGRIWRCRGDGVECEEQGTAILYNKKNVEGLPYNRVTFIQQLLSDGRYLLCDSLSTLGYFLPERREFQPLNAKLPQLGHYRHLVGACPVNKRWTVVYAQNGIFMLDTEADTIAPFPAEEEIGRYTKKYNCMAKDGEGRLWIGTQNGLWSLAGDSLSRIGDLRSNCIRSLVVDNDGHVWAGTSCGISRITPSVVNMGTEDGIPEAAMLERASHITADGHLVFATTRLSGVMFHPDSLITDELLLPVVITAAWANGNPMNLADDTVLPYNQNYVSLQFSTLDYAHPSHTRYRYRLAPFEKEWNTCTNSNGQGTAAYTALPPGQYVFEVQSGSTNGEWSTATQYTFTINPSLWLTWWAKALYALLLVVAVGSLLAYYLRRKQKKMERENDERVNYLFELRDEARNQFAKSVHIDPQKITQNKEEQILVEQLLKAIGEHMGDEDYTVDLLASDVAMSRSSLYKKMQTMLGITPNDFMRNVRLKHAARLLAETETPINQVAVMVGFQTPRYFSQCFRQLFGVNPSEYRGTKESDKR